jgi:DNA-binding beta-propeller fold protein YncE
MGQLGVCALVACLAAILPSPAGATTENATSVMVSPSGSTVYAGFNGAGFSVFSRDPSTGELSILGEAATSPSGGPLEFPAIAPSPDGMSLYGVDDQSNTLFQYAPTSGGVTEQQSYPVLANPSDAKDPTSLAVSPDGSKVYVLTYGTQYGSGIGVQTDGKINAFARNPSTGALTLSQSAPVDAHSADQGIVGYQPVVSPDGKYIYVSSNASGGLDILNASNLATTTATGTGLNSGEAIAISPDAQGSYVLETGSPFPSSSANSEIVVLSRNASTGAVTQEDTASGIPGLSDMWGITVSPNGKCVYATSRADNSLGWLNFNSGVLSGGGVVSEGENGISGLADARQVTVSPDGKNLYVASPNDDAVAVFSLSTNSCAPTFVQEVQDLFTLSAPVLDPSDGTATLPVNVESAGELNLALQAVSNGASVRTAHAVPHAIPVAGPGVVNVPISLSGASEQELTKLHQLTVRAAVTFTASGGTPTTKTIVLTLVKNPPSLTQLRVSPHAFAEAGRVVRRHCVAATRRNRSHRACRRPVAFSVSYRLSEPASVTFTVAREQPGRTVRHRCVKPTRRNRKDRRCTQLVTLRGGLAESGRAGANRFRFGGKIGGRRLGPGTYVLTAVPSGGKAVKTTFTITG